MTDPLQRAGLEDAAAAVRAEWRADEEEWSRAALEHWQHRRTLLDVVRECMHRGDTVAFQFPHATFTGRVCAVGSDVVVIDVVGSTKVDVSADAPAPIVVRVLERARAGGTRGEPVTTFRARLLALEMDVRDIEVGLRGASDTVRGRLEVGDDHVIVHERDRASTVIALAAVAWVRPVPE